MWICKCPWPRTTDGNSLCSPQSSPTAANLAGVLPHIQVIMLMIILTWELWSWLCCDIYVICRVLAASLPKTVEIQQQLSLFCIYPLYPICWLSWQQKVNLAKCRFLFRSNNYMTINSIHQVGWIYIIVSRTFPIQGALMRRAHGWVTGAAPVLAELFAVGERTQNPKCPSWMGVLFIILLWQDIFLTLFRKGCQSTPELCFCNPRLLVCWIIHSRQEKRCRLFLHLCKRPENTNFQMI